MEGPTGNCGKVLACHCRLLIFDEGIFAVGGIQICRSGVVIVITRTYIMSPPLALSVMSSHLTAFT